MPAIVTVVTFNFALGLRVLYQIPLCPGQAPMYTRINFQGRDGYSFVWDFNPGYIGMHAGQNHELCLKLSLLVISMIATCRNLWEQQYGLSTLKSYRYINNRKGRTPAHAHTIFSQILIIALDTHASDKNASNVHCHVLSSNWSVSQLCRYKFNIDASVWCIAHDNNLQLRYT